MTSLAGISGLSSFPPVQTHLADKTDFECLKTHSMDLSRGGNIVQKQYQASEQRSGPLVSESCLAVLPTSHAKHPAVEADAKAPLLIKKI